MYNFLLVIWYYFVGKPKVEQYIIVEKLEPENLKFGLVDNIDYLYQYFIGDIIYFFWGDFIEGTPGLQIESYLERTLVTGRWNQIETGFEVYIEKMDWVMRHHLFLTWDQDWGEDIILAIDTNQHTEYLTDYAMWMVVFFYVYILYWSVYFTFRISQEDKLNFFDVFHQTEDQYFDYYQQYRLDSFNIFEDGLHIVPSWVTTDYDSVTTQDYAFEDHKYMDPADFCEHPSEESDRFLDFMFDARGYVHFELYESLMDATVTHRYAHAEDRLDEEDILQGFENTSMISSLWWDDIDVIGDSYHFDQYAWQFKESKERSRHPYFFFHPMEHYQGLVDPWIMLELTWDYEPWLEDNFSVVIMGDVLVEEVIFSLYLEDGFVDEVVDEVDEENDYDYYDFEGIPIENDEIDQLVYMPLWREYELIPLFDEVGNKSNRTWMPEVDWTLNFNEDPLDWDWEDWEEVFDEGSDGMYSDNDASLEDAHLINLMGNDLYFENMNHDVYGGALMGLDINDTIGDEYMDYSTEYFLNDMLEGLSPYGRNEERIYESLEQLSLDYSYVPIDRLLRNVEVWEVGNSMEYIQGEVLLDVSALVTESYGLVKTTAFQLNILYNSLRDLKSGVVPEYPVRWNAINLYYEVYNLETYSWVKVEDVIKYLVLDLELLYNNRRYLLGYSTELLLKIEKVVKNRSFDFFILFIVDWFLHVGLKEYYYFILLLYYSIYYSIIDFIISLGKSIYSFLKNTLNYVSIDLVIGAFINFIKGEFYSNYGGVDLLAYDSDYTAYLFKTRCALRLDLETMSQEEELYPTWWVKQGIFDQDFYLLQLNSYDPRNPLFSWTDRAFVMTYPEMGLAGCGNLDMVEIINPDYLVYTRKENPNIAANVSFEFQYYDYIIFEGFYERDPSQWVDRYHFIRGSSLFSFLF